MELDVEKSKKIIILLTVLLTLSIISLITLQVMNTSKISGLESEKISLTTNLETKISEYNGLIAQNNQLKSEFETQKNEMEKLLSELKVAKANANQMSKYKAMYFQLKRKMDKLLKENKMLKAKNKKLTQDLDSTNVVLGNSRKLNDELLSTKEKLEEKVELGSRISIAEFKALPYRKRKSGKMVAKAKAGRVNTLKVSFVIAENLIAPEGEKTFYVQILTPDKKTLDKKTSEDISYTFSITSAFNRKSIPVIKDIPVSSLDAGKYIANLYNVKGEIVSKKDFELK